VRVSLFAWIAVGKLIYRFDFGDIVLLLVPIPLKFAEPPVLVVPAG